MFDRAHISGPQHQLPRLSKYLIERTGGVSSNSRAEAEPRAIGGDRRDRRARKRRVNPVISVMCRAFGWTPTNGAPAMYISRSADLALGEDKKPALPRFQLTVLLHPQSSAEYPTAAPALNAKADHMSSQVLSFPANVDAWLTKAFTVVDSRDTDSGEQLAALFTADASMDTPVGTKKGSAGKLSLYHPRAQCLQSKREI